MDLLFRMSAGARLTVIRPKGKRAPAFRIAVFTRSLDSWTAVSGSPTIVIPGWPFPESTSTSTRTPSNPITAQFKTLASIRSLYPSHHPP